MKKQIKKLLNTRFISGLLAFASIIVYYSCNQEKGDIFSFKKVNDSCQTCTTVEGTPLNVTLFNQPYDLTNYTGTVSYSVKDFSSETELTDLTNHINLGILTTIKNDYNIIGLAIYSKIKSEEINNLDLASVKGMLIYYTEKNSPELYTKLLVNHNGTFELDEYFSTKTKYVASNDILDLSQKKFSDAKGILFFLRNKEGFLNFENDGFTEFSGRAKYATFDGFYEPTDGSYCTKPCKTPLKDYLCTAKESPYKPSQDVCAPSGNLFCGTEKSETKLISSNNSSNYNFANIKEELRAFRDNSLKRSRKGVFYINLYYYLSEKLNDDFYTVANCIEIFDVLTTDIVPMIYRINNNSSEILISTQSKSRILSLLNKVDISLREKDHQYINTLKNDINTFYGMTAIEVKNYIKNN